MFKKGDKVQVFLSLGQHFETADGSPFDVYARQWIGKWVDNEVAWIDVTYLFKGLSHEEEHYVEWHGQHIQVIGNDLIRQ